MAFEARLIEADDWTKARRLHSPSPFSFGSTGSAALLELSDVTKIPEIMTSGH